MSHTYQFRDYKYVIINPEIVTFSLTCTSFAVINSQAILLLVSASC
jgi:hypothetical protein